MKSALTDEKIPTKIRCSICNKIIWGQTKEHAKYLLSQHRLSKICISSSIIDKNKHNTTKNAKV